MFKMRNHLEAHWVCCVLTTPVLPGSRVQSSSYHFPETFWKLGSCSRLIQTKALCVTCVYKYSFLSFLFFFKGSILAKGQIGTVPAGLHHSHTQQCWLPHPLIKARDLDPHGYLLDLFLLHHNEKSL